MKERFKHRWKLFRSKKKQEEQVTIGIIGAGRSVGVTHFAFMLAGYLSGVERKTCAVLEWNRHGDLNSMKRVCSKDNGKNGFFRVLETDCYASADINTLLLCKKSEYQTLVVDYGSVSEGNLKEFLRCDRQFVVGSLSEWQMSEFVDFERNRTQAEKSWESLLSFGSEEARKNMEKKLRFPVRRIPLSVDPFIITSEIIDFYKQLY
ncbi:hypothetical protein [Clostridium sp. E02]|uniref:hypothetical protein n=1 Tax=Clostridium sp. E02 TaxID=2487134 RepID=UPI000F54249D|nr:hypothetical protein [Clostridium sp. E02]